MRKIRDKTIAKLAENARRFEARASKVPVSKNLFEDREIKRLMKEYDRLITPASFSLEPAGTPHVYRVLVDAGQLVVASGRSLPYATWIGTVDARKRRINVWTPAASVPRGYRAAAEEMLESILESLPEE